MSKTLREQLLDGDHRGCSTWQEVAAKLGKDERHLRAVRKTLVGLGHRVDLEPRRADVSEPSVPKWYGDNLAAFDGRKPLAHFDSSDFRDFEAVEVAQQPYEPPVVSSTRKLTKAECPDGTMILWASDIHIPIHHEVACRLMVECAERSGVSHVVIGGDGLDINCLSKHAKESHRTVEHATLLEEVEPGRWLLNWAATKKTKYILGNHEDRAKRFIDENPAFHGSVMSEFARLVDMPPNIEVLPQGGEVRLGNLAMFHGDAEFKNGSGGQHPAHKLLSMLPDQSSMCGHLHRMGQACRTTRDEDGIRRTRRAWTMGHMSIEEQHYGYVSKNPNWQVGFGLIRVYWEGDRPRWTVYPVEVLFDRNNRAYFEFEGRVYR